MSEDPRGEMLKLGNHLVFMTDQVLKMSKFFFRHFNKEFFYVRLDQFVFQDSDYLEVAVKEVEEITSIFASYEIFITKLEKNLDKITFGDAVEEILD